MEAIRVGTSVLLLGQAGLGKKWTTDLATKELSSTEHNLKVAHLPQFLEWKAGGDPLGWNFLAIADLPKMMDTILNNDVLIVHGVPAAYEQTRQFFQQLDFLCQLVRIPKHQLSSRPDDYSELNSARSPFGGLQIIAVCDANPLEIGGALKTKISSLESSPKYDPHKAIATFVFLISKE